MGQGERRLSFPEEITRAAKKCRSKKAKNKVFSLVFTEAVYQIWLQRNMKIFNNKIDTTAAVVNRILFNAAYRCSDDMSAQLV